MGRFTFDYNTPFPGLYALVPAVGATLLIWAGQQGPHLVGLLLSLKPMVMVGLMSYSIYLWHWPLIVFAEYYHIRPFEGGGIALLLAATFAMGWLSWRFVERPFRGHSAIWTRPVVFRWSAVAMAAFTVFGGYGLYTKGWPERLPKPVVTMASAWDDVNPRRKECHASPQHWVDPQKACVYGGNVEPTVALWGDSHADAFTNALLPLANASGQSFLHFSYSGCPGMIGVRRSDRDGKGCMDWNTKVMERILSTPSVKTVVMGSRWAMGVYGPTSDLGPSEKGVFPVIAEADNTPLTVAGREALFARQLRVTVEKLQQAGKQVILVYSVPEVGYHIPSVLGRMLHQGKNLEDFTNPVAYFKQRQQNLVAAMDAVPGVVRIHPADELCDDVKCKVVADGMSLYEDDDHLSGFGARYISHLFAPVFGQVTTTSQVMP